MANLLVLHILDVCSAMKKLDELFAEVVSLLDTQDTSGEGLAFDTPDGGSTIYIV